MSKTRWPPSRSGSPTTNLKLAGALIRPQNFGELKQLNEDLLEWLRRDALPLWETYGVDRVLGGYYESLAYDASRQAFESHGEMRRGRVIARQMFVFNAGRGLGWDPRHEDPLHHGCRYLFSHMLAEDGLFHTAVDAKSRAPNGSFSLYEWAFYLFALAKAYHSLAQDFPLLETAARGLELLRQGFGKASGGFEESRPPSVPLKSNPHMHLLEAALAWIDATQQLPAAQAAWVELAQELIGLCLSRFLDPASGALREFFDACWQPMPDDSGKIVEPGHQFEWGWLLLKWAESPHCAAASRHRVRAAARRLVDLGERFGVDPARGVAFNELWDDLRVKDAAAKLWPQTERVKAWCAVLQDSATPEAADLAGRDLAKAILGMQRYLRFEPPGLWQEVLRADGTFTREPTKASSFYHVVCAIETLKGCVTALEA
jgi:mannose/cellobiose epimerase-like protein (N-acyl-D-glucosamine 2-epimerase family)